jgi:hypothetical protein
MLRRKITNNRNKKISCRAATTITVVSFVTTTTTTEAKTRRRTAPVAAAAAAVRRLIMVVVVVVVSSDGYHGPFVRPDEWKNQNNEAGPSAVPHRGEGPRVPMATGRMKLVTSPGSFSRVNHNEKEAVKMMDQSSWLQQ